MIVTGNLRGSVKRAKSIAVRTLGKDDPTPKQSANGQPHFLTTMTTKLAF